MSKRLILQDHKGRDRLLGRHPDFGVPILGCHVSHLGESRQTLARAFQNPESRIPTSDASGFLSRPQPERKAESFVANENKPLHVLRTKDEPKCMTVSRDLAALALQSVLAPVTTHAERTAGF